MDCKNTLQIKQRVHLIFNLLFALSLIYLMPSHLRTDTMILDEIDSMLDARARDQYAKEIIPEVQQHISKLIVVSPLFNGELNVAADRSYRVVKTQRKDQWISTINPA